MGGQSGFYSPFCIAAVTAANCCDFGRNKYDAKMHHDAVSIAGAGCDMT